MRTKKNDYMNVYVANNVKLDVKGLEKGKTLPSVYSTAEMQSERRNHPRGWILLQLDYNSI